MLTCFQRIQVNNLSNVLTIIFSNITIVTMTIAPELRNNGNAIVLQLVVVSLCVYNNLFQNCIHCCINLEGNSSLTVHYWFCRILWWIDPKWLSQGAWNVSLMTKWWQITPIYNWDILFSLKLIVHISTPSFGIYVEI